MDDPVNLTPHSIVVQLSNGRSVTYETTKGDGGKPQVARVISTPQKTIETLENGVPVVTAPNYTSVEGLIKDSSRSIIVSQLVADYLVSSGIWNDARVYVPDTGPESVVRDSKGGISAVKRLIWFNRDSMQPPPKLSKTVPVPEFKGF